MFDKSKDPLAISPFDGLDKFNRMTKKIEDTLKTGRVTMLYQQKEEGVSYPIAIQCQGVDYVLIFENNIDAVVYAVKNVDPKKGSAGPREFFVRDFYDMMDGTGLLIALYSKEDNEYYSVPLGMLKNYF